MLRSLVGSEMCIRDSRDGDYSLKQFIEPNEKKACSFERIYFSRGNDPDIYNERKNLGKFL